MASLYCIEVEDAPYRHPAVVDAALIGLPHRTRGEEPAAVVCGPSVAAPSSNAASVPAARSRRRLPHASVTRQPRSSFGVIGASAWRGRDVNFDHEFPDRSPDLQSGSRARKAWRRIRVARHGSRRAELRFGPEAALAVLAGAGAVGLGLIGPIMAAIVILLAVLWFSYWQTIAAYPNNGGSYVVAHENLGTYLGGGTAHALGKADTATLKAVLQQLADAASAGELDAALAAAVPTMTPKSNAATAKPAEAKTTAAAAKA